MTQVFHDTFAKRTADDMPARQRDIYVLAGTEGTDVNDPRAVSVPDETGNYILLSTINALEPIGDYTILADETAYDTAAADYQTAIDDARDVQETAAADHLSDYSAAQFAAYTDLTLNGMADATAQFICHMTFPDM